MCAEFHPISSAIRVGEAIIHRPATSLGIASFALGLCTYVGVASAEGHDANSYRDSVAAAGSQLQANNLSAEAEVWSGRSGKLKGEARAVADISHPTLADMTRAYNLSQLALKDSDHADDLGQTANGEYYQSGQEGDASTSEHNAAHADERNSLITGGADALTTAATIAFGFRWANGWSSARAAERRNRHVARYQRPIRKRREKRERREKFMGNLAHPWRFFMK